MGPRRDRRETRAPRGERGFTLLELLMTLGVTTVGLVGLMALHMSVAQGNDLASRSADAAQVANTTLESYRAMRRDALGIFLAGNGNPPMPVDVNQAPVVVRGISYRRRVIVTTPSADLWLVRVEVGWTEDGAAPGANGGAFDHLYAVEALRPIEAL